MSNRRQWLFWAGTVVVFAVVLISAETVRRRRSHFQELAEQAANYAAEHRDAERYARRRLAEESDYTEPAVIHPIITRLNLPPAETWCIQAEWHAEHVAYQNLRREKYEHATRYPWLRVAPDPAPPYPGATAVSR